MLTAYAHVQGRLTAVEDLTTAVWVDVFQPTDAEAAAVTALGVEVPTLEDMEEIEVSNRLYQEGGVDYMTVVLPGQAPGDKQIASPVCLILAPAILVTVRHHAPRPFETFPARADKSPTGCERAEEIFLGLLTEITGRLADLLEGTGRALDRVSTEVFGMAKGMVKPAVLARTLADLGQQGEGLGRVRLALLTLERALSFHTQAREARGLKGAAHLALTLKTLGKDIQSLEVHGDYLSTRVALVSDATMGMINLAQNTTVRILSVVAALFLPPTLIGTVYGMNFTRMPELGWVWGYPAALAAMLASAVVTYLILWWKNWL
jgi:magnesium transporter